MAPASSDKSPTRVDSEVTLAFALTGLCFALPALQLPFVVVRKFGADHAALLLGGFEALQQQRMPLLATWVLLCGTFVPIVLLLAIAASLLPERCGQPPITSEVWSRAARMLGDWLMPEVHVLAVLVAFVKLGTLVHVRAGAGLWCYGAMSLATLVAWRKFTRPTTASSLQPLAEVSS